jgi:hypothetical protein
MYSFRSGIQKPAICVNHFFNLAPAIASTYTVLKKNPSGLWDMITYMKTKKKVSVNTCPKMLGFPHISLYVFFTRAIIPYEPLNT